MLTGPNKTIQYCIVVFLFAFVAVLLPGLPGHIWDNLSFKEWAGFIHTNGLKRAYLSDTDYPPLYQYILWAYAKLAGTEYLIGERIGYLRLVTLAAEMLGLWLVYKWTEKRTEFVLLFLFCVLNPAFSYNTIIWGQMDGMLGAFVFIALYYAWERKMIWSTIWFLLALNLKLQAIIFLPVWGLLLLIAAVQDKALRKTITFVATLAVVQLILLYPFLLLPASRQQLYKIVSGAVDRIPYVSIFAFNLWHWVFPQQGTIKVNDSQLWMGGLSYRNAGLLLFFTSSLVVLIPVLKYTWSSIARKASSFDKERLWLVCAAIPLLFFFCNTQMHERYCHPAFIFLTAYAFSSRNFLPYILFSIAYFLNLEKELQWLRLVNYDTLIFDPQFIAGIYLLLILYIMFRIYKPLRKRRAHALRS